MAKVSGVTDVEDRQVIRARDEFGHQGTSLDSNPMRARHRFTPNEWWVSALLTVNGICIFGHFRPNDDAQGAIAVMCL